MKVNKQKYTIPVLKDTRLFFFVAFNVLLLFTYSQNHKTDSLKEHLTQNLNDTNRIHTLNALSWQLQYTDPDTAIILGKQALWLAEKNKHKIGEANSNSNLGVFYWQNGDYSTSLPYHLKALGIRKELGSKKAICSILSNIGLVYTDQGNHPSALSSYFEALETGRSLLNDAKTAEEQQKLKFMIGAIHGNIGIVYRKQTDYLQALKYYYDALKINTEMKDKEGMAINLGCIGTVYQDLGMNHHAIDSARALFDLALQYHFRSLTLYKELKNKNSIAKQLNNIGTSYYDKANRYGSDSMTNRKVLYKLALGYYNEALEIDRDMKNKNGMAIRLGNLGALYKRTGEFKKSEKHLLEAIALCDSIGYLSGSMDFEEKLSRLYDTIGNYGLALLHYKKHAAIKDSIFNEEKSKDIGRLEAQHEFDTQQALDEAEHKKELELTAEREKRQQVISYSVAGGLVLVLVFALFIFNRFRVTRRQKGIIEEQKRTVEEKQREIIDSITYARRIQRSLLPTDRYIEKHLLSLRKKG